jgi:hypothetical protein
MKVEQRIGVLCVLLSLVVACGPSNESESVISPQEQADRTFESAPALDPDADAERILRGELRSVDIDEERLMVASGDELYTFEYSDETTVIGGDSAGSVQGLAGSPGTPVTVRYDENALTGTRTAVSIERE